VLHLIRSERLPIEQISYNVLFRCFVGLPTDGTVWDQSTFNKNRDRLLEHDVLVVAPQRDSRDLARARISFWGAL